MKRLQIAGLIAFLASCSASTAKSEDAVGDSHLDKVIEEYCSSVIDLAAERRAARQTAALADLESKVAERLDMLEQRTESLSDLIRQQKELRSLADKELVEIYAGVDAEAAAAQMERLDLRLASSVLRQLKPRQASTILNVMKPQLAAELVRLIASSSGDGKVTQ